MKRILKIIGLSLIPALGGVLVVLGEQDDSPGLGGIGLLLIGITAYLQMKATK